MKRSPGFLPAPKSIGWADVTLAAVVVAAVALMIVPLPASLLDVLLSSNLAASVTILLVTLYVPDALHIASFPTVLLITTLFRLALNIAATRLILLHANAGEVIHSFGRFVVGSNYVVGTVIFILLTLVQYLVVAKGSERVAEVGARFTLDAMPGKQMAIDADLRAGTIDADEATRRRRQLGRESQFYGAMDGAMKFVKGDIVASILIAAVNLVGGLAIGIGQRNLEAVAALKRYGLLTIGSGLITQISALILATSAGVLVTRVASEEPNTSLAAELGAQFLGTPKALLIAALFVVALSLVPGLPFIPFFTIGVLLFFTSRARARYVRSRAVTATTPKPIVHPGESLSELRFVPVVEAWSLKLAPDLANSSTVLHAELTSATDHLRERLFMELGVPLPACSLSEDPGLPVGQVCLHLHEVPGIAQEVPVNEPGFSWLRYLEQSCLPQLRQRAADFIGIAETQRLLNELERVAPQIVRQVVPKPLGLATLSEVLRRLVDESVPIRDLSSILEALSQGALTEKDPLQLTEHVRKHMQRTLTQRWTQGTARLPVILLDPSLEDVIRTSITRTATGAFLALAPSACKDVVAAIRRALEQAENKANNAVLLSAPDIRRFVRRLIENDLRHLSVVSASELLPEIILESVATASVAHL